MSEVKNTDFWMHSNLDTAEEKDIAKEAIQNETQREKCLFVCLFVLIKRALVLISPKGGLAEIMAKDFLLLMKILKDTQQIPSIRNLKKITPRHINFISLKSLLETAPLSFGIKYYCREI